MTSAKPYDFLSELKATLSKLTAHDEPDAAAENASVQPPQLAITLHDDNQHRSQQNHQVDTDRETSETCGRSVLFGELSSVLEKRGQQHHQLADSSRVVELESRLKPGKSVIYLGSGQRKDSVTVSRPTSVTEPRQLGSDLVVTSPLTDVTGSDILLTLQLSDVIASASENDLFVTSPPNDVARTIDSGMTSQFNGVVNVGSDLLLTSPHNDVIKTGGDLLVTSRPNDVENDVEAAGCSEEDTDVMSTSSALVSVSQVCPSSNHGNQDSACIMSADESSDCSLLTSQQRHHHRHHHQQQQQQPQDDSDKSRDLHINDW